MDTYKCMYVQTYVLLGVVVSVYNNYTLYAVVHPKSRYIPLNIFIIFLHVTIIFFAKFRPENP